MCCQITNPYVLCESTVASCQSTFHHTIVKEYLLDGLYVIVRQSTLIMSKIVRELFTMWEDVEMTDIRYIFDEQDINLTCLISDGRWEEKLRFRRKYFVGWRPFRNISTDVGVVLFSAPVGFKIIDTDSCPATCPACMHAHSSATDPHGRLKQQSSVWCVWALTTVSSRLVRDSGQASHVTGETQNSMSGLISVSCTTVVKTRRLNYKHVRVWRGSVEELNRCW